MAKPNSSKMKRKKKFTKIPERETKTIFVHYLFYIFCNKS